jgi:hypothetical protein
MVLDEVLLLELKAFSISKTDLFEIEEAGSPFQKFVTLLSC